MSLLVILVFVGLLLLLVLIHELGHFLVAKWAGCRVEEFGFGFPPRLFAWRYGETDYSLNLLPIGGFVKIEGENMDEPDPAPTSFAAQPARWRLAILVAGVTMNLILAPVLLSIQGLLGTPVVVTNENAAHLTNQLTYITEVSSDSPAAAAGIKAYDRVARVENVERPTLDQVQEIIAAQGEAPVELELDRQGQRVTVMATPRLNPPPGQGALGIGLMSTGLERVPWWQAPWHGVVRTGQMITAMVTEIGNLIGRALRGDEVGQAFTGPVGIAVYAQEATYLGPSYLLEFAALISINLALINILPLPALDGGRILFIGFEKLLGRRVPGRIEHVTHTIGFVLLIGLMIVITWRDVVRLWGA